MEGEMFEVGGLKSEVKGIERAALNPLNAKH